MHLPQRHDAARVRCNLCMRVCMCVIACICSPHTVITFLCFEALRKLAGVAPV